MGMSVLAKVVNHLNASNFVSMVINSKEVLEKITRYSDSEAKKEWDATFKLKKRSANYKNRAFLRRTSLDELPQLFNVLKGGDESGWAEANHYC
ncbi:sugar transferase [Klebsiella pneumoniae subsp. pneumoniae]|nr:sugar transferase [Klebsiella pneumoniae subsp. pneumoniae]